MGKQNEMYNVSFKIVFPLIWPLSKSYFSLVQAHGHFLIVMICAHTNHHF
jgi:hypothetical protein